MKRRSSKKASSPASKKTKVTKEQQSEEEKIVSTPSDADHGSNSGLMVQQEDDDFNPDIYNVEELIQEFNHVDSEIMNLEKRRQDVLRILKKHPITRIKYSTVNRWEKTKEMIAGSQFHNVSADCLGLIFSFIYGKEMLEVETVKKISSLSTNFHRGLLHYSPFILCLNREIKKFNENSMPDFHSLHGIEFAPFPENLKIVELLIKKSNYSIKYLSIRCDITNTVFPTLSKQAMQSIQILKYVESHNQTRGKLDISLFTSLTDVYIAKLRSASASISFPSHTLSRLSFSFPHCGSSINIRQLFDVSEHLTLCLPNCIKASNNVSDSETKEHYSSSKLTKTMTCIRFKTNAKKPDLMEQLSMEAKFYKKRNINGDAEVQEELFESVTITEINNKLQKEFDIPLETVTGSHGIELSELYIEKVFNAITY